MAISYEDYKKKIQEKYKYTTERNPRKPLNQRYNAIARVPIMILTTMPCLQR